MEKGDKELCQTLGITQERHDELRKNSDMGDPDAWKVSQICEDCINNLHPDCDVMDWYEQLDIMNTGECEFYIKKHG